MSESPTWITRSMIYHSRKTVYVFGDNMLHVGMGGQAWAARPFVKMGKSYGLVTKRDEKKNKDSYFADRDDEIAAVKQCFKEIIALEKKGKKIVFMPDIGQGRAELAKRSPIINAMIRDFIAIHEKIDVEKLMKKR